MGTGWRNAFCTTIPRSREFSMVMEEASEESEEKTESQLQSSRTNPSRSRFRLSSGNSNPSTPRLQSSNNSPKLLCKTNPIHVQTSSNDDGVNGEKLSCKTASSTPKSCSRSPRTILIGSKSSPSSPRSPFSVLKNSLCFSKNNSCGVCIQSVKAGQGKAIYTAECSHTFHFPCIVEFLGKQATLFCPICKSPWKDGPLFTTHNLQPHKKLQEKDFKTYPKSLDQNQIPFQRLKTKQENEIPQLVKCYSPKINYHDDEPLISPKFNPIPEEQDDDLEDEVGEFKGFFVNSTPDDVADANKEFRNVEISLLPESTVIATGRTHETVALNLKIKAPPPPQSGAARRAPIDLVSVLDVSGSMNGSKLHMLKRAIGLVISSLGSADRLSIVAFTANPKRLMPLRRMNAQGQRLARRIIDRLECGSGTCANEALTMASEILEHRRERNPVASIILLSGGGKEEEVQVKCDNQQQKSTQSSTTRFSQIEIPVHSFGLGEKPGYTHYQEDDAFSKCVGGLLSVVVQDLRVQLSFASGSSSSEILAVYSCTERPEFLGSDLIRVGDLYAEEEKEFLIEIRVPISNVSVRHHVLSIRSSYKHVKTQELVYNDKEHALLVPNQQTLQGSEQMRNLFISIRTVVESRRLIEHNELNKALQLLSSARALVKRSKIESAKDHINNIEVELGEVQRRMHRKQQTLDQVKIVRRRMEDHQGVSLFLDENGDSLKPTSAWKTAEKLAKMAMMKKSFNRVGDLHGLENARF